MPKADRDFHPDDPSRSIWEKLLRKDIGKGRPQSAEERQKKSKASKGYYEENPHHGQPTESHVTKLGALAACTICGGPIYSKKYAKIGVGPTCLRKGVELGHITIEDGKYVLRKRNRNRRRRH